MRPRPLHDPIILIDPEHPVHTSALQDEVPSERAWTTAGGAAGQLLYLTINELELYEAQDHTTDDQRPGRHQAPDREARKRIWTRNAIQRKTPSVGADKLAREDTAVFLHKSDTRSRRPIGSWEGIDRQSTGPITRQIKSHPGGRLCRTAMAVVVNEAHVDSHLRSSD
jgi:hypothetical protein